MMRTRRVGPRCPAAAWIINEHNKEGVAARWGSFFYGRVKAAYLQDLHTCQAVEAGGLENFLVRHGRQDRWQSFRQHGLADTRGADE